MVEATIDSIPAERPEPTEQQSQGMCLDKGYDSGEVRDLVKEFGYTCPSQKVHPCLFTRIYVKFYNSI